MGIDLYAGMPGTAANDYEDEWCAPGLDASWSFGGFNAFRERLAIHEGFFLNNMAGFTNNGHSWDLVTTPLKPLLNHSDWDGEMTPPEAAQVWPRLAAILDEWETGTDSCRDCDYDVRTGRNLVEILRYSAQHQVQVLFR